MLGDLGQVLPRQSHGTIERPAAGWYAVLADDDVVFLGDYTLLAIRAIENLRAGHPGLKASALTLAAQPIRPGRALGHRP